MQAARLLIKLCLALAPFAAQAGDVKVSVRLEGWRPWFLLALLAPRPVAPAVSGHHLGAAPPSGKSGGESGIVYVGGVQYRLSPPPRRD